MARVLGDEDRADVQRLRAAVREACADGAAEGRTVAPGDLRLPTDVVVGGAEPPAAPCVWVADPERAPALREGVSLVRLPAGAPELLPAALRVALTEGGARPAAEDAAWDVEMAGEGCAETAAALAAAVGPPPLRGAAAVGGALAWLMVNRPAGVTATLRCPDFPESPLQLLPPAAPVAVLNPRPCRPEDVIDVFHVHTHFDEASMPRALLLRAALAGALRDAGAAVLHEDAWTDKNGPHYPFSCEVWVERPAELGLAVLFLVANRVPGFHHPFHCDSDNEYVDHAARVWWVGEPDALDVGFFTEAPGYEGPQPRRSNAETFWSMGHEFRRGEAVSY